MTPLRIRLPYATEEEFIDKYGSNVGRGGFFVATRSLKAEGTPLAFELVLADGSRLMRGEGVVQKTQIDQGGSRAGMTVRFVRLDAKGRTLVERIVASRAPARSEAPPSSDPTAQAGFAPPERSAPAFARDPDMEATEVTAVDFGFATLPSERPEPTEVVTTSAIAASSTQASPDSTGRPATDVSAAVALATGDTDAPSTQATQDSSLQGTLTHLFRPQKAVEPTGTERAVPISRSLGSEQKARRRSLLEIPAIQATPSKSHEPEVVLGLDLGTLHCRLAALGTDPAPKELALAELPATLRLDENGGWTTATPGGPARASVVGLKRLLGRRARDADHLRAGARFGIVPDERGDIAVEARGQLHSVETLSTALLEAVKSTAADKLRLDARRLVVCVPVDFTARQRAVLMQLASNAGLHVLRLVSEPAAAAVAFGHGKGFARRRLLVFDLGAGGFGTAVVEMTGDDAEVVAAAGDADTGSLQLTQKLVARLTEQMQAIHPTLLENVRDGVLEDAIERALRSLVAEERAQVRVELGAALKDGPAGTFESELDRAEVERLTADVLNRAVALTLDMLKAANLDPTAMNEVLLVGGATALPWVQQRLSEIFRVPLVRVSADAVARGAGVLGEAVRLAEKGKPRATLSELLPTSLGVGVPGGGFFPVLDRFTRLPAQKTVSFPVQKGDRPVIAVFQGTATRAEDNAYLGLVQLAEVTRAGEGSVRFDVSQSGTLRLLVSAPGVRDVERPLEDQDVSGPALLQLLERAPPLETGATPAKKGLLQGLRSLWRRD